MWGFAFAALVPALIFAADEIAQNRATIRALGQLKTDIYTLWDQLFTGKATEEELERTARQWQDEIYRHRQNCPLLPNAFYDKYRDTDEAAMWESSGALVDEALRKMKQA